MNIWTVNFKEVENSISKSTSTPKKHTQLFHKSWDNVDGFSIFISCEKILIYTLVSCDCILLTFTAYTNHLNSVNQNNAHHLPDITDEYKIVICVPRDIRNVKRAITTYINELQNQGIALGLPGTGGSGMSHIFFLSQFLNYKLLTSIFTNIDEYFIGGKWYGSGIQKFIDDSIDQLNRTVYNDSYETHIHLPD